MVLCIGNHILCWKNRIFIFDFLFVLFCDKRYNKLHSHCEFCGHVSLVFIANAWANCNYFMYFRIYFFDRWIKLHMVELIQCNILSFVREEKKYILDKACHYRRLEKYMYFSTRIHVFNLAFLLFFLQNSGYLCNTWKSSISCIFHVFYMYFTRKKMLYYMYLSSRKSVCICIGICCMYLLSRSISISTLHREITIFMLLVTFSFSCRHLPTWNCHRNHCYPELTELTSDIYTYITFCAWLYTISLELS